MFMSDNVNYLYLLLLLLLLLLYITVKELSYFVLPFAFIFLKNKYYS
jgi:hypothetical protein